jgi:hypothetical protein
MYGDNVFLSVFARGYFNGSGLDDKHAVADLTLPEDGLPPTVGGTDQSVS